MKNIQCQKRTPFSKQHILNISNWAIFIGRNVKTDKTKKKLKKAKKTKNQKKPNKQEKQNKKNPNKTKKNTTTTKNKPYSMLYKLILIRCLVAL